jgi:alpha-2-macroglobulin
MRTLTGFALLILLALGGLAFQGAQTSPQSYDQLRTQAEKFFGDQSFSLARELYLKAATLDVMPVEKRWVSFRLADTLWRAQAASQTADSTHFDQAREELERLVREAQPPELRDRIWAEAQQSLGDFWWTRRNSVNWGQAWPHYQQALEWWAASPDIDLARRRYLEMVWTMSHPGHAEPYYYYGYYGNVLPLEVVENALKIAQTSTDKAHLHYLVAMTLRHTGDWDQHQRPRHSAGRVSTVTQRSDGSWLS